MAGCRSSQRIDNPPSCRSSTLRGSLTPPASGPGSPKTARTSPARSGSPSAWRRGGARRSGRDRQVHPRQLAVDQLRELGERFGPRKKASIDEERRRTGDPERLGVGDVTIDDRLPRGRVEGGLEPLHVEPEIARLLQQDIMLDARLAGEDLVVIGPELPLIVGRQRRQGGERRI